MSLTIDQIKALPFGYLTGKDLVAWAPYQLLNTVYSIDQDRLQEGCSTAYAEMTSATVNRYDIATELAITTPANRSVLAVKIITLLAVRNICGSTQAISEKMAMDFKWVEKAMLDLRNAQMNLPLHPVPSQGVDPVTNKPLPPPNSRPQLVKSNFGTCG